ncbi:MAG TPA: peptidylprolyl isomerase [Gemmatimonadaceae bacterium]|jgi:peptidyl-prolyl cis-trans isomerase A (cyclophilin A)
MTLHHTFARSWGAVLLTGALTVIACGRGSASHDDTASAQAERTAAVAPTVAAPTTPAPDSFNVRFETSRGPFVARIYRRWAPKGADRFYELVQAHFYDENRFFRVVPGFVAQFGINDKPKVNDVWDAKRIPDDSVKQSNGRGTIVFATEGPNTRTHQLFINLADNGRLDPMGFAPMGRVVDGMATVDSLYNGYGEQPDQQYIQTLGNSYLNRLFPKLDYIKTARVVTSP